MHRSILKKLDFPDKYANVYLALAKLGPSSVRALASECELNRGTTYDALKWLQEKGVVQLFNQDSKQHFVVEPPQKLLHLVTEKEQELAQTKEQLSPMIAELSALYDSGGNRPIARYFSGKGIADILQEVLDVMEQAIDKTYRLYSTAGIRERVYKDFPTFSDVRIEKRIAVNVISIGDGGELRGLDDRKWIDESSTQPTYIILYDGHVASISLDAKEELVGVIIRNKGVYETERIIFDRLWNSL